MKPTVPGGHDLEEQQLWHSRETRGPTPARFRSIHYQGFLRREGDQGPLRRGNACRVEDAAVDVFDLVIPPVVTAIIFRQDDVLKGRPPVLARHPEPHLCLGQAGVHVEVVAVQGHTAVSIRRPREQAL
jgi:hypothetical protein